MYQWADGNIESIKFFCFNGGHCFTYTLIIQNRLTIAETIDGTTSYHCFQPNGQTKLELYTLSTDEISVVTNLHGSKGLFVDINSLKIGHYVAAVYESHWYPSCILKINWDQRDLLFKSMHKSCIRVVMAKTASFGHPEMIISCDIWTCS